MWECGECLTGQEFNMLVWPVMHDPHHDDRVSTVGQGVSEEISRLDSNSSGEVTRIVPQHGLSFLANLREIKKDGLHIRKLRDQRQAESSVPTTNVHDPVAIREVPILWQYHSRNHARLVHQAAIVSDLLLALLEKI